MSETEAEQTPEQIREREIEDAQRLNAAKAAHEAGDKDLATQILDGEIDPLSVVPPGETTAQILRERASDDDDEPEPLQDPNTKACDECDGWGIVKTGSLVPDNITRECQKCKGRGYLEKRPATPPQPVTENGEPQPDPPAEPEYVAVTPPNMREAADLVSSTPPLG